MTNLKYRLTSRKLWIAVLSTIVLIVKKQYPEAMGVVITYLTLQGTADAIQAYTGKPIVTNIYNPKQNPVIDNSFLEDDDVDSSTIVTGNPLFDEDLKK